MGLCRVCQLKTCIAQTLFWLIIYRAFFTCYPNISFNLNVFLQMYHSCSFILRVLSKSEWILYLPIHFIQYICISSNISYPYFKCSFFLRLLSKSEWLIFFLPFISVQQLLSFTAFQSFPFPYLDGANAPSGVFEYDIFFTRKKFYTSHKSISTFLLTLDLWTLPTRVNLWQKYPKVSVLRYSKNRNLN